jgi:hypothetical protein
MPCGHTQHPPGVGTRLAPLLPKVRGQVAEFLDEGSPERLTALTAAYQCRFAVRAVQSSGDGFSWPPAPRHSDAVASIVLLGLPATVLLHRTAASGGKRPHPITASGPVQEC